MNRPAPLVLVLTLLVAPAVAADGTYELMLPGTVEAPFDEQRYEDLLERAVGEAPEGTRMVRVVGRTADGARVDVESLLPLRLPPPDKEESSGPRPPPPVDAPGPTSGWLSGKAVYVSQCHGWIWFDSLGGFSTQRGNLFDTVEDFHNPEGANQYLVRYLENSGAAVFTVKERDMTSAMGIADNDGSGYAETGSGFETGPDGFGDAAPWVTGEDPFDSGTTRRFPADGGATATWTPDVPSDGVWAVYVSWDTDSANAPDAHYRIHHPGGIIDRTFDQTVHGSTWQYVETLWLPGGTGGLTVELIGDSAYADRFLSADVVRVGGGMGDVQRMGDLTGRPRWEEGANLYTQYNGAPLSVYDPNSSGIGSDVAARSRWAAWEHPSAEDAVYLSWHSNAGGGTGTVTLTYDGNCGGPTAGSSDLAWAVQDEIVDMTRDLWDSEWSDRGVYGGGFGELSPCHNDEMPQVLVELGFHDHEWDTQLLKEPRYRMDASRAMYRGIAMYFADRDGLTPTFLPEPPTHLAVLHAADGTLRASWQAGVSGFPYGDPSTGYVVYTSTDGRSWDNGTPTTDASYTLPAAPNELVYVRVAASNAGGISFPTETLGARRSWDGTAPVLIVDAYDRLQASQLIWEDVPGALGLLKRLVLPRMNGFDTTVRHADAVAAHGWPFDSVADEAMPADLSGYRVVLWAAGEDSTADEAFDDAQQAALRDFVDGDGALWASGSEILWDLDYQGSATDQAFAADVLGAGMAADDSGTTAMNGVGLLDGLQLDFAWSDGAAFDVDYPDVLDTSRETIAEYDGGGVAAALGDGVVLFGVPFEAIGDEATRREVAARLLAALVPDYVPPVEPGDDDDDDVSDDDDDSTAPDDDDDDSTADDDDASAPVLAATRHPLVADDAGCGCSSAGAPPIAAFVLVLMTLGPLRRRYSVDGEECQVGQEGAENR